MGQAKAADKMRSSVQALSDAALQDRIRMLSIARWRAAGIEVRSRLRRTGRRAGGVATHAGYQTLSRAARRGGGDHGRPL